MCIITFPYYITSLHIIRYDRVHHGLGIVCLIVLTLILTPIDTKHAYTNSNATTG